MQVRVIGGDYHWFTIGEVVRECDPPENYKSDDRKWFTNGTNTQILSEVDYVEVSEHQAAMYSTMHRISVLELKLEIAQTMDEKSALRAQIIDLQKNFE